MLFKAMDAELDPHPMSACMRAGYFCFAVFSTFAFLLGLRSCGAQSLLVPSVKNLITWK